MTDDIEKEVEVLVKVNLETNLVFVRRFRDPLTTLHVLLEGVASQIEHARQYKDWSEKEIQEHVSGYLSEAVFKLKGIR